MVYRITKLVHNVTATISLTLFFLASSTSDFSTEIGQKTEPECVGALIKWGIILLLPTAMYLALDYYKRRWLNR